MGVVGGGSQSYFWRGLVRWHSFRQLRPRKRAPGCPRAKRRPMPDKPEITAEDGDRAARALLSFWKKGHRSRNRLKKLEGTDDNPLRRGQKLKTLAAEAEKADLNPDLMKKAWRLAELYEREEIEDVCRRVRERPARFG